MDKTKKTAENELARVHQELVYLTESRDNLDLQLTMARKELAFEKQEKEKRTAELAVAIERLELQDEEKGKRAAELGIANIELATANKELIFQNEEKEKRAAELIIANKELAFQNEEKEKRAREKEGRAAELIIANEELLFQNREKEKRAAELEEKNKEVEAAKSDIEKKTRQLEVSSKYKSEFLANMSHELRTPLNSLLILSKDLSENKKKNLTEDQVEGSEIIYKSGRDLLTLINEVLDLSKIEAGKMTLNIEKVSLKALTEDLVSGFKHNVEQKGLRLNASLDIALPEYIHTDPQRLKQILKNLISNAVKFTDKGSVSVSLARHSETHVVISVSDTGIGIPESKQMAVFEAFQQADGTTSRKYGGTGLGLSISRELAKLLGAEITLSSVLEEGSTFSVIMPIEAHSISNQLSENAPFAYANGSETVQVVDSDHGYPDDSTIRDDRNSIERGDKVVLVIEDDLKFAAILLKLAGKKGYKCLFAATGEDGFMLAKKYAPSAIILDIGLPGIRGHELLLKLKSDHAVRHIPVHIVSGHEISQEYLQDGAVEFMMKPVSKEEIEGAFNRIENFISRKIKNLLIIEDDLNSRKAMKVLIGGDNVNFLEAENGRKALTICNKHEIDCIILDIDLPDMTGLNFIQRLEEMKGESIPRIIVYTGVELTNAEKASLKKYTKSIILKGVESGIPLLKETALFLHRTSTSLEAPADIHRVTQGNLQFLQQFVEIPESEEAAFFSNRKILLVDDDYRNVFALSKMLTDRGMEIIKAENGKIALEKLESEPGIELVLMDIMMPEMDGYEAMRRIRAQEKFKRLPVIAVTAKAMSYDEQKCIDAGASDYITKPIEIDHLLLIMSVLLGRKQSDLSSKN
jgi:signal transduction histidine kinase/CheY-like chemotaxis protein